MHFALLLMSWLKFAPNTFRLPDARPLLPDATQKLPVVNRAAPGRRRRVGDDPQHAFPGHGQMKPEQLEIAQLKREVAKLKAERDILKKAAAYFAKEST